MKKNNEFSGLSERHVAQIVRRNMIQKVKPSGKTYKRKKYTKKDLAE
jgi:hypothetical protein